MARCDLPNWLFELPVVGPAAAIFTSFKRCHALFRNTNTHFHKTPWGTYLQLWLQKACHRACRGAASPCTSTRRRAPGRPCFRCESCRAPLKNQHTHFWDQATRCLKINISTPHFYFFVGKLKQFSFYLFHITGGWNYHTGIFQKHLILIVKYFKFVIQVKALQNKV